MPHKKQFDERIGAFEDTYPRYTWAPLVGFGLKLAEWLVAGGKSRAQNASSMKASHPSSLADRKKHPPCKAERPSLPLARPHTRH